jgi:hypothetical protein
LSFAAGVTGGLQAQPAPESSQVCRQAVQDNIAWNYKGDKHWAESNIKELCAGAEDSIQPARCFEHAMHGGLDWGGGTRWQWKNALALCKGTRSAKRTIVCFEDQIMAEHHWRQAIDECQRNTVPAGRVAEEPSKPEVRARREDGPETPRVKARRVESSDGEQKASDALVTQMQDADDSDGSRRGSSRRPDITDALVTQMQAEDEDSGDRKAVDWNEYKNREWGYIKASSGLCLTMNVFDQPSGRKKKVKKAFKKMFDPREHAKAMAGAAGAGLVFGPGGPELAHSIQALRQAKKVSESWQGDLRQGTGVTLLECGSVEDKYQGFRRDGRFFVVASGLCLKGKQGQAAKNGGRVQIGKCKRQKRSAWYVNGKELSNGKNKCLDVHRPQLNKEGARVQLWDCNGQPQQRWTFTGS